MTPLRPAIEGITLALLLATPAHAAPPAAAPAPSAPTVPEIPAPTIAGAPDAPAGRAAETDHVSLARIGHRLWARQRTPHALVQVGGDQLVEFCPLLIGQELESFSDLARCHRSALRSVSQAHLAA